MHQKHPRRLLLYHKFRNIMLRPKKVKKEKVQLTRDSYKKARRIFSYLKPYRISFLIGWIFLGFIYFCRINFPGFTRTIARNRKRRPNINVRSCKSN